MPGLGVLCKCTVASLRRLGVGAKSEERGQEAEAGGDVRFWLLAVELLQLERAGSTCAVDGIEYRDYSTKTMWAVCPATEPHAMKPTGRARHRVARVVTPPRWGVGLGPPLLAAREKLDGRKTGLGRDMPSYSATSPNTEFILWRKVRIHDKTGAV